MIISLNNESPAYRGIGDLFTLAWLSEAAKTTDDPISFYTTDTFFKNLIVNVLNQELAPTRADCFVMDEAVRLEKADLGRESRTFYAAKSLNRALLPKRPTLGPFPTVEIAGTGPLKALLFPKITHKSREWPWVYWMELYFKLKAAGHEPCMVFDRPTIVENVEFIDSLTLPTLAGVMKTAKLVITQDSMPLHLAGTLDLPTLALLGPTTPALFSYMPSVTCLTSFKVCTGCMWDVIRWRPHCRQGCSSLFALSPERVFNAAVNLLEDDND